MVLKNAETNGLGDSSALAEILLRLERLEVTLRLFAQQQVVQASYSTTAVAKLLGKAEFTVREWCRLGRIRASKRSCGRGNAKEWMISHEELQRIQSEGLLPSEHRLNGRSLRAW